MSDSKPEGYTFDVVVQTTQTVRVRFPNDPELLEGDEPDALAQEFAMDPSAWAEWAMVVEEDQSIESVRAVLP